MLRRAIAVALATFVGVPALTPPADAASRIRVSGTYQLLVADGTGRSPRATYQDMLVSGTKAYRLSLRGRKPRPGTAITVSGRVDGSSLSADTIAPLADGSLLDVVPTAVRNRRVLVILATWTVPDAMTQDGARTELFGKGDAWQREVSYGAEGLTGDVTPWVTIAGPTGGLCYANHRETMTQAKAAALLLGYDPAAYEKTVLYFPRQTGGDCGGYGGWAYQPGTELWLNGALDRRTTMHELGHSNGLPHASSYQCVDEHGHVVTLAATGCTRNEYGDPADAMGASAYVAHFSAAQKSRLGWLASAPADLSEGGSTVLAPYEAPGTGVAAAKVTVGTRTYWLEHRTSRGADASLPAGSLGLLVHMTDPAVATQPMLLDLVPDGNFTTAALAPGGTWTTPEGYAIAAGTPTAAGLPVTVSRETVPGAVTGVTTLAGDGTVTVSWSPATGGGTPTEYRITAQPGGATTSVGAAARSVTMSGLVNGTSYVLSVTAVNALGAGEAVSTAAVVPADVVPPSSVSGLKGTLKGSRLVLTWTNPSAPDLTEVVVRMVPGTVPPSSATAGTLVYSGTGRSAEVGGMSNKVTYAFAVFPRDEVPNWGRGAGALLNKGRVVGA